MKNIDLTISIVLFVVFLVLKLTKVITWSWWWVTSPLWILMGLFFLILFIVYLSTDGNINKRGW